MRDREKEIDLLRQIDRYLNGELTEAEVDQLWEEFLKEPKYLDWMEAEAAARIHLGRGDGGSTGPSGDNTPSHSSGAASPRRWFYSLAALVALLVVGQSFPLWRTADGSAETVTAIPVQEMITVDVFRSAGEGAATAGSDRQADELINLGYSTALTGDPGESLEIYEQLLEMELTDYQKAVAQFNAGVLLYNQARHEEAALLFEQARDDSSLSGFQKQKAMWFLGQALLQLNETRSALELMVQLSAMDGSYSQEADQTARELEQHLKE